MKSLLSYSMLLYSVAFLPACGQRPLVSSMIIKSESGASNADASTQNKTDTHLPDTDPSSSHSPSTSPSNGSAVAPVEISTSIALPPTAVSGATLTCIRTVNTTFAACELPTTSATADVSKLAWTFFPSDGSQSFPINTKYVVPLEKSSLVYLDVNNAPSGRIIADDARATSDSIASTLFSYDAATSPAIVALPFDQNWPGLSAWADRSGEYFFGPFDGRDAGCKKLKTIPVLGKNIRFNVPVQHEKVEFSLSGVCGLESRNAKVRINFPPPMSPMIVTLVPGEGRLVILSGLTLPPGDYSVEIDNRQNLMPDGTIDSYQYDWFNTIGTTTVEGSGMNWISASFIL